MQALHLGFLLFAVFLLIVFVYLRLKVTGWPLMSKENTVNWVWLLFSSYKVDAYLEPILLMTFLS